MMHSINPPSYPTYEDILDFIEKKFNKNLRTDALRKLLLLQLGEIFNPISAKPLGKDRNDVEVEQIEDNYLNLRQEIYGIPIQFFFNIDEIGHTDISDAVLKTVIVPYNFDKPIAYYPVNRTFKRASVVACISPTGLVRPPQFDQLFTS